MIYYYKTLGIHYYYYITAESNLIILRTIIKVGT